MPNMTGQFTGKSTLQTIFSLHDTTDHEMSISEVRVCTPQATIIGIT